MTRLSGVRDERDERRAEEEEGQRRRKDSQLDWLNVHHWSCNGVQEMIEAQSDQMIKINPLVHGIFC